MTERSFNFYPMYLKFKSRLLSLIFKYSLVHDKVGEGNVGLSESSYHIYSQGGLERQTICFGVFFFVLVCLVFLICLTTPGS